MLEIKFKQLLNLFCRIVEGNFYKLGRDVFAKHPKQKL